MRRLLVLAAVATAVLSAAGTAAADPTPPPGAQNLETSFSCNERPYGYYADPETDNQVFHVCLPAQFPDGTEKTYKWSFICPQETHFDQEASTCTRRDDA
ncbi:chitin-binding domain-containing protein [Streptomyces sp. NPDC021093]|uniref:chitin binding peritrophin-A domain-containing protein n=1 Tax=Streptomyces sp. NPDC021093 TaxID=3365112 RepID=UPI00378CEA4B